MQFVAFVWSVVSVEPMECPITYELFADSGDNAPLMLSACGHTISAFAAAHLIATERTRMGNGPVAIRCPMCAQKQQVVCCFDLVRYKNCL